MAQPRLWVSEIFDALIDLGGEGSLNQIYQQIEKRNVMDLSGKHWQAVVRRTIEEHSSDTIYFHTLKNTQEDDIFYAPKGKGSGFWAIRKHLFASSEDLISVKIEEGIATEGFEGGKKQRYVNVYERDLKLRSAAIKIHGTICKGCNFDFEAMYGERGTGYIEVHHLRPVSQLGGSVLINPRTDMTVLCPNCHRMIHRYHDNVLSLEELQSVVAKHKKKTD